MKVHRYAHNKYKMQCSRSAEAVTITKFKGRSVHKSTFIIATAVFTRLRDHHVHEACRPSCLQDMEEVVYQAAW